MGAPMLILRERIGDQATLERIEEVDLSCHWKNLFPGRPKTGCEKFNIIVGHELYRA